MTPQGRPSARLDGAEAWGCAPQIVTRWPLGPAKCPLAGLVRRPFPDQNAAGWFRRCALRLGPWSENDVSVPRQSPIPFFVNWALIAVIPTLRIGNRISGCTSLRGVTPLTTMERQPAAAQCWRKLPWSRPAFTSVAAENISGHIGSTPANTESTPATRLRS